MVDVAPEVLQTNKDAIFGNGNADVIPATSPHVDASNVTLPLQDTPPTPALPTVDAPSVSVPITPADNNSLADEVLEVNEWLKNTFGLDNEEAAKTAVQEWRSLKETPPPPTFSNEEAKKWYQYLQEGKEEEIYNVLHGRRMVKEVGGMNDEQKLRLFIKMQNPLFDDELINYTYENKYKLNEEDYVDDPMRLRFEKVNRLQQMQNDLKSANDYFTQYQSKIELPDISPKSVPVVEDEGYKQYLKLVEQDKNNLDQLSAAYSKLSENDIAFKFPFNDEASKLGFESNFVPDKDGFEEARQSCLDWYGFVKQHYYAPDGSPLHSKFVRDTYILKNLDKVFGEVQKQSVNATIQWFLNKQKNGNDPLIQRNFNTEGDMYAKNKAAIFG